MSLDHYRSDPARVDWRSLEDSDLSPLGRKEGKSLLFVASLAALDLLERKGWDDASMPFIKRHGIRNIHITCYGRRKHACSLLCFARNRTSMYNTKVYSKEHCWMRCLGCFSLARHVSDASCFFGSVWCPNQLPVPFGLTSCCHPR